MYLKPTARRVARVDHGCTARARTGWRHPSLRAGPVAEADRSFPLKVARGSHPAARPARCPYWSFRCQPARVPAQHSCALIVPRSSAGSGTRREKRAMSAAPTVPSAIFAPVDRTIGQLARADRAVGEIGRRDGPRRRSASAADRSRMSFVGADRGVRRHLQRADRRRARVAASASERSLDLRAGDGAAWRMSLAIDEVLGLRLLAEGDEEREQRDEHGG